MRNEYMEDKNIPKFDKMKISLLDYNINDVPTKFI